MARCRHWRRYDLGSHRVATEDGKWSFLSIQDACQGRSAFSGAAVCSPSLGAGETGTFWVSRACRGSERALSKEQGATEGEVREKV